MKLIIEDDSSIMRERIIDQVRGFDQVTLMGEAGIGTISMETIRQFYPVPILLDLYITSLAIYTTEDKYATF